MENKLWPALSYLNEYFDIISKNYREILRKKRYQLIITVDLLQFIIVGLYPDSYSIMESRFRVSYNNFFIIKK